MKGQASPVHLREICDANRPQIELLRVTPEQEHYVTGVAESLEEAAATPRACPWYRALYAGDQPVGFDTLLTSVVPGPASPLGFYLRYGFSPTGQVFDGEDVLELRTTH